MPLLSRFWDRSGTGGALELLRNCRKSPERATSERHPLASRGPLTLSL